MFKAAIAQLLRSELRQKFILASMWSFTGAAGQRVLQLVSNLILTALLFPEAFGIMALVNVVLIAISSISDVGISSSIIQSQRGEDDVYLNTAWTLQVIRGFVLFAMACLLSYPVAIIYGEQQLFALICFVSITSIVKGFQSASMSVSRRNLKLKRIVLVQVGSQLCTLIFTSVLAFLTRSVWALAIGAVFGIVLQLILGYIFINTHRHRFCMDRQSVSEIIHFGKWIFLSSIVAFVGGQGIRAIEGLVVPLGTLGIISIASIMSRSLVELYMQIQRDSVAPAMAQVFRENSLAFSDTLRKIRVSKLSIILPAFVFLSLISVELIKFLYDERYHDAGVFLAILSINGALLVFPLSYLSAFVAQGNTRLRFYLVTVSTTLRLIGFALGWYAFGVLGMLAGTGLGAFFGYLVVAFVAGKKGLLRIREDSIFLLFVGVAAYLTYTINIAPSIVVSN